MDWGQKIQSISRWFLDSLFAKVISGLIIAIIYAWLRGEETPKKLKSFPGVLIRLVRTKTFIITFIIIVVTASAYQFGIHRKIFPDRRAVVILTIFSHNADDNEQREAWRATKVEITEGFNKLKHEINFAIINDTVETEDAARNLGKGENANLVIWGRFFHSDNIFRIEPRICLISSIDTLNRVFKQPGDTLFPLGHSLSRPTSLDIVIYKAQQLSNIVIAGYGSIKMDQQDYETAISFFESVRPQTAEILLLKGNCFLSMNDYPKAIECYKQSIDFDSNYVDAWINWGFVLDILGDHKQEILKYNKATEINSHFAEAWFNWGVTLDDLNLRAEAIVKYELAVSVDTGFYNAWYNWGIILADSGLYTEAIDKYKKVLKLKPDFSEAWYNWALCLERLDKYDSASVIFEYSLSLNPLLVEAWLHWGITLGMLNEHNLAIKKFTRAIQLKPNYPDAWHNRGISYLMLNEYTEAEFNFREAIRLQNDYPEARQTLGITLLHLNRIKEAKDELILARKQAEGKGLNELIEQIDKLLKGL